MGRLQPTPLIGLLTAAHPSSPRLTVGWFLFQRSLSASPQAELFSASPLLVGRSVTEKRLLANPSPMCSAQSRQNCHSSSSEAESRSGGARAARSSQVKPSASGSKTASRSFEKPEPTISQFSVKPLGSKTTSRSFEPHGPPISPHVEKKPADPS
eukprot:1742630-Amphidinium_carterae.1